MTKGLLPQPVADLHCDLLSYLVRVPNADLNTLDDIGASLPHLKTGNVKLQVLAMFTLTQSGSVAFARAQAEKFKELSQTSHFTAISSAESAHHIAEKDSIGIVPAIENASGLCEEDEPVNLAFKRLEEIIAISGKIFYIGITHHTENRFGGGNYSDNIGLKPDGEALLDYLHGRNICIDLAHTSDALAYDILNYGTKQGLDIPIIASHSNFRPLCDHVRNLPDELAQEVIQRNGLIGINFLRDYVDKQNPDLLYDHIKYGKSIGAENMLAFGADFFCVRGFPDADRHPLFFPDHENASTYPAIIHRLINEFEEAELTPKLAWNNVMDFLKRIW